MSTQDPPRVLGGLVAALGLAAAIGVIGYFVVGMAGVMGVAALFYAIGASEDRERDDDPPSSRS